MSLEFASVPDYQYYLALAYFGVTHFQDSVATFKKLLLTNPPRQDRIYFLLGDSYLNLGQYDPAEEAYKKAIAINPKDTAYYEALASLERREGSADLGEAIAALEAAHRLDPNDTTLSLQLALSYEAKGEIYRRGGTDREKLSSVRRTWLRLTLPWHESTSGWARGLKRNMKPSW